MSTTFNAQNVYEFGALPAFNVGKGFDEHWSLNFELESRQIFNQRITYGADKIDYVYEFTDATLIAKRKIGKNMYGGAGYLFRSGMFPTVHRTIQQFGISYPLKRGELEQRVVADQSFTSTKPRFRFRYRLAYSTPLGHAAPDKPSMYFKINNEYVGSFRGGVFDLEVRGVSVVGVKYSKLQKIEMGFDYRLHSFLKSRPSHKAYIVLSWYTQI